MKLFCSLFNCFIAFAFISCSVTFANRISSETRQEIDRLKNYIQYNESTCFNFYKYSCGNYVKNVERQSYDGYVKSVKELFTAKLEHQVKSLLTERRSNATSFERKAFLFYKTCQEGKRNKTKLREQLNDFLKSLSVGGWPVWTENWNFERFDVPTVISEMRLYGFTPLFNVRIAPSPRNTTGKIFVVDCAPKIGYDRNEDVRDKFYLIRYEEELRRIFLDFGTTHREAAQYARDVLEFEKGLLQIVGDLMYYNDDNVREYHYQAFTNEYWKFNWDDYFKTVFRLSHLKGTYVVSVKGSQCLKSVLDHIREVPPTIFANYLLTSMVSDTYELTHPGNTPNFCVHATSDAMNPAISYMYLHKYFNEKNEIDLHEITESLIKSHLKVWRSYIADYNFLSKIENKLNRMRIVFFSDHIDILEEVANSYLEVIVDQWNFVTTYFRFIKHNNLNDIPKDYARYIILSEALRKEPFYIPEKNAIIIPPAVIQLPYYNRSWSKLFKYSKIGFLIGRAISEAFDKIGRTLDERGNKRNWWHSDASLRIEQNLITRYSQYVQDGVHIDSRITLRENWADLFGLHSALYAYLNVLSEGRHSNPNESIPRIGLTLNQTFFVSFAQNFCEEHIPYEPGDTYSPAKLRVNGPISFLNEFSQAFGCK